MRIVYLYQPGRIARLPELRVGKLPTEFFYGAPELEKSGHDIFYVEAQNVPAESKKRIALELLVKLKYLPAKVYFAQLFGVKNILPALTDADVIIATTPGLAFSLATWKSLGAIRLQRDFIAIHCGILNYSQSSIRKKFSRNLFKHMRTVLYGQGELASMQNIYHIPSNRIEVNCFGVDDHFWTPSEHDNREDYVLSIGNDSRRDYELLIQAAQFINRPVKILTRRVLPTDLPKNVEVVHGSWHEQALSDADLRELYRNAFCVVVPLVNSIQPSGQSVTLQAMACETPVILTKTDGLWETSALQDGENILFIKPEDSDGLAGAVNDLQNPSLWQRLSKAGRNYINEHGRIDQFAQRMESLCHKVMETNKSKG